VASNQTGYPEKFCNQGDEIKCTVSFHPKARSLVVKDSSLPSPWTHTQRASFPVLSKLFENDIVLFHEVTLQNISPDTGISKL
jgi:hypothetical protein